MDKLVDKIAERGVLGLVLLVSVSAIGYSRTAAKTALNSLGVAGLVSGGVRKLPLLSMISKGINEHGFEKIYFQVLKKIKKEKGLSEKDIIDKINNYPISKSMKLKLINKIKEMSD